MAAKDPWTVLGGYIRSQRQLAQLSLRELAARTNVSNAYLSQIERGLHEPSVRVITSIADALQLSAEALLSQAGVLRQVRRRLDRHRRRHRSSDPGGQAPDRRAETSAACGLPQLRGDKKPLPHALHAGSPRSGPKSVVRFRAIPISRSASPAAATSNRSEAWG